MFPHAHPPRASPHASRAPPRRVTRPAPFTPSALVSSGTPHVPFLLPYGHTAQAIWPKVLRASLPYTPQGAGHGAHRLPWPEALHALQAEVPSRAGAAGGPAPVVWPSGPRSPGRPPQGLRLSALSRVPRRSLCQSSTSSPGSGKVSGLTVRVGRVPPLVSVHGPSPPQHTVPRGRSRGGRGVGPGGPRRFSLKPDCEPWQLVFGAGTWPGPSRRGGPGGDHLLGCSAGSTMDASWDPACFRLRPPRHRRGRVLLREVRARRCHRHSRLRDRRRDARPVRWGRADGRGRPTEQRDRHLTGFSAVNTAALAPASVPLTSLGDMAPHLERAPGSVRAEGGHQQPDLLSEENESGLLAALCVP